MFQNWGFLLTEIVVLLALAALLGLFIGWLIWGRSSHVNLDTSEADGLRAALAECKARGDEARATSARLQAELADAKSRAAAAEASAANAAASASKAAAVTAPAALMSAPAKAAEKPAAKPESKPAAAEAAPAPAAKGTKPKGLTGARDGKADDLKLIKGIGPALEKLCHKLGYFHFDQLAAWTATEIAWVDDNLEGFKGRVTRDEWVAQARDLMNGKPPRPGGEK